jgi:hypothetical protein
MKKRIPVKLLPEPMLINFVEYSTPLGAIRRLAEHEKGN